ncbi:DUF4231 domain-containing protein [Nocardiopsis baichengensis]|uniref:DUF4231 domain-containing protein n=1 Tax=Nocardiopsis baichengensis TaxID=280240 RepID=UPI00034C9785|nr:DUF4231 domain-containing protein [Nocardiopsis baichengensis]
MPTVGPLRDDDLPGLYQAAEAASSQGRRRYGLATGLRLGLVVSAAVSGMLASLSDAVAVVTAFAFFGALLVETYILTDRPDRAWYEGRALAEAVKTLTWRYAVGAAPFGIGSQSGEAKGEASGRTGMETAEEETGERFRDRVDRLLRDAPRSGIAPTESPVIGERVREFRSLPALDRREIYLQGRVIDQQRWYAGKARFNRRRAFAWRVALLLFEGAGFLGALAYALDSIDLDFSGIMAALVGAGAAWMTARQYDTLARSYSVSSNELSIVRDRLEGVDPADETRWAEGVADVEDVIIREHAVWRASRSSSPT